MATVTDTERREHSESRQGPRECDTGPINVTARARERETARERERERENQTRRKKEGPPIDRTDDVVVGVQWIRFFFSLCVCVCVCVCVCGPTATSLKAT